jgi:hypothetical protein
MPALSSTAWADTVLVPSISVSERYDTNVFFITAGGNLTDYVTTIAPSLSVQHKGRVIEGSLVGTVMGEIYALNPGLNYIAPSGTLNLNLDQVVGRIDRRLKLIVTDSFTYTPRPPGFLSPDTGSVVPQDFVRGIQTMRANSITNIGTVAGSYGLTSASNLLASYTHMYMRFGNFFLPPGTTLGTTETQPSPQILPCGSPFFTTTMQILTVGPEIKVTPRDIATLSFQGMDMEFEANCTAFAFQTKGGLLGWKRKLTQQWSVSGSGGLTILTPGNNLQYLANGAVEWKHRDTSATLSYSRTIFPSFFIAAAPLLSQVIALSGKHKVSEALSLTASANYALNETIEGPLFKFESYAATIGMTYTISRTVSASASYLHSEFVQGVSDSQFSFDRDVLQVTLRKEWR